MVVTERREQDAQILVCYDGSDDAKRAVDAAAALLGPRPAVVLNVAPAMTLAESLATTPSLVPGGAFEDLNRADALIRAEAGASRARRAGLDAEALATIAPTTWQGILTSPTSSTCRSSSSDRGASVVSASSPAAACRTTWRRTRGDRC